MLFLAEVSHVRFFVMVLSVLAWYVIIVFLGGYQNLTMMATYQMKLFDEYNKKLHLYHPADKSTTATQRGQLFTRPMNLLRRGEISQILEEYGSLFPYNASLYEGDCSCQNPNASSRWSLALRGNNTACCTRIIRRNHKMGYALANTFINEKQALKFDLEYEELPSTSRSLSSSSSNASAISSTATVQAITNYGPNQFHYLNWSVRGDWRLVLLLRDIYDALISGYLYHKGGMECSKSGWGRPMKTPYHSMAKWGQIIRKTIPNFFQHNDMPLPGNRTLCQYLEEESEEVGMHGYIQYIFHGQYHTFMNIWSLGHVIPMLKERTLTICYKDLMSNEEQAVRRMQAFYRNQTEEEVRLPKQYVSLVQKRKEKQATVQSNKNNTKITKHGTSHDPLLHDRLRNIIVRIDETYYDRDIEWLHSTVPCL